MARHTFRVEHIQQGLEQIKRELGPAAIIVQTRRVNDEQGRMLLEITAEDASLEEESHGTQSAGGGSSVHHNLTQVQKTILGLTEQLQRVQSELRHMRMEFQDAQSAQHQKAVAAAAAAAAAEKQSQEEQQQEPQQEQEHAARLARGMEILDLSRSVLEKRHAEDRRSLSLALARMIDQSGDRNLFESLVAIHSALRLQDVAPEHADLFCARLLASNKLGHVLFESARDVLTATMLTAQAPWEEPEGRSASGVRVQIYLGPAGSGKTSTVAKLAAHAAIRGDRRVALIGADAFRLGGHDQVETYAELIDLPFASVDGVPLLERAVEVLTTQRPEVELVMVDATSFVPFEVGPTEGVLDVATMMEFLEKGRHDYELYLVLPATWSTASLIEYVEAARVLQPAGLIWTMLDVTRRYGALYSVSQATALPVVSCATGRAVPADLGPLEPRRIAEAILSNQHTLSAPM